MYKLHEFSLFSNKFPGTARRKVAIVYTWRSPSRLSG